MPLLLAILTLAVASPLAAQSVSGTIVDGRLRVAVQAATVELVRAGATATTDEIGAFWIGADGTGDTLVVAHEDFETLRLPLGSGLDGPWTLELQPARPFQPQNSVQEELRARAADLVRSTGGEMWRYEDFTPYLVLTQRALPLLTYSGLVHEVDARDCVVIRPGGGCALVHVVHQTSRPESLDAWLPSEVDAFVVLPGSSAPPPDELAAILGAPKTRLLRESPLNGVVVVFMSSES